VGILVCPPDEASGSRKQYWLVEPFSASVVTALHSQGLLHGTLGGGAKVWPLDGGFSEPACVHWRHQAHVIEARLSRLASFSARA
jgi:hypothetical protein